MSGARVVNQMVSASGGVLMIIANGSE